MDLGRLPHGVSNSLANSAFSTQSSISSQLQSRPIITTRTPSPSKRPLPAPSSHSPVKKSESVGLSRTSSLAIQNSASASPLSATPKRRTTPPKFQSQPSSEASSPTKENAPASSLPLNKFSGLPAAVSAIPKSTSTTTSSTTSATTSNSTSDTLVPPPKKFTPIWKHTIPDYPAPAWGYAVGMVSEPHPKPKAQVPTQLAPAGAPPANDVKGKLKKAQNDTVALPPPTVPAVSSTKGTTQHQQYSPSQYRQLGQPASTSFTQSGVQQRHTYQQQQQQAYYGHGKSPATYSETQDEDEEDEEEDSEEETDSDEEVEDDEEVEEQPDPRYNPQNKRQKFTRPMASIANGAGVPSQSLSRGYDQKFEEEMICTPKRKLRLKPKVKMNKMDSYTAYIDVNSTNGHKSRIVPRRGRDEDITPKATKIILKPKKHILSEKQVGFGAAKRHTVHLWDASDDDGQWERKRFQVHERSRSAYEEREREVAVANQRRQLERKMGSAFSVDDERIIRRRQDEDDREVGLAYDDDDEEEGEEDTRKRGRRQVMKNGTPRETPERRKGQGQVRGQGPSPQWDIHDIPANRRAGPAPVTRYGINYEDDKEEEEEDLRYCCVRDKEKEWDLCPLLKPTNRRLQESGSTAMVAGCPGVPEKSMKGGPKWKSTPLKYDDYDRDDDAEDVGGRRKLEMQYHQQEEMTRKFAALRMNDRTSLVHNQGSTGWPADLPRLPRTPGSSSGSVTDDGGDYFDTQPQPVSVVSLVSECSGRQLRSAGISGKTNISLEDPRPRVTVRSSSPVLISRRQPLPQPPRHPENQTYNTSGVDDRIGERLQLRRSLYSDPGTMRVHEEEGLKKRPQSQIYVSATTQMQAPIGSRNQQQQQSSHLPFSNHESTNYQPQTPAPLPIIGIESPHPVGGRDRLADIPMLEEGSNDESEGEHRQQPNHRRVQVPRINVASDPSSSSPPPPRIQVDGPGPSIPSINLNSSPRMNSTINNDSGPIINIEPPRINVDGGDSPRGGGGPNISVSQAGPVARNLHTQSVSQQPQFGRQQTHGRQARPAGGLICGGCNGSIIGRIVSAMGSRWHPACFRCTVCNELLEHVSSYEHEGRPYCHLDYHEVRSSLR